jgi:hypothetical protein
VKVLCELCVRCMGVLSVCVRRCTFGLGCAAKVDKSNTPNTGFE